MCVYIKKKKKYRSKTIDHHHHLAQEKNATHTHIRKRTLIEKKDKARKKTR